MILGPSSSEGYAKVKFEKRWKLTQGDESK